MFVNIQSGQSHLCDVVGDGAVAFDLGKITYAAEQQVGDTGCATAAAGDFEGGIILDGDVEDGG